MRDEHSTAVAERIFALIEADFESDAAFERAACLPDKTVNNWRRGRSSSYMKRLPMLSDMFHVSMSELLGLTDGEVTADLSEEEWRLVHLYRRARVLPKEQRAALWETLSSVVTLYLNGPTRRDGKRTAPTGKKKKSKA